jgi:hypothetical protein
MIHLAPRAELRYNEFDGRLVGEEFGAIVCARRQKISMATEVIEGG